MDRILAFTCEMAIESFVEYDMDAAMEAGLGGKIGNIVAMAKKAILALLAKIRNGIKKVLNMLRRKSSADKSATITRQTDLALQYLHEVVALLKKMPKIDDFVRRSTRDDYIDDLADIRAKMNDMVKKVEGLANGSIRVTLAEKRTNKTTEAAFKDFDDLNDAIGAMEREIKFSAYGTSDTSRIRRDEMLNNEEYMRIEKEHVQHMTNATREMQRIVGLASQACGVIFGMISKDETTATAGTDE